MCIWQDPRGTDVSHHWSDAGKKGGALTKPRFTLEERFWRHVVKTETCWLWNGGRNLGGYGAINVGGRAGGMRGAHRVSYELFVGPIPDGFEVDHLCKVPACVRPEHLEAVPPRVNNLRSNSNAAKRAKQTHCRNGHPFTPANTYVTKRNQRVCRRCQADWQKDFRKRGKTLEKEEES